MDREPVNFLSILHESDVLPLPDYVLLEGNVKVQRPGVVRAYHDYLHGVDVADQLRGSYSTFLAGKKWWRILFYWGLDTALCNAYVLWRAVVTNRKGTQLQFRELLIQDFLMKATTSVKRKSDRELLELKVVRRGRSARVAAAASGEHLPIKNPENKRGYATQRRYQHCSSKKRRFEPDFTVGVAKWDFACTAVLLSTIKMRKCLFKNDIFIITISVFGSFFCSG